MTHSASINFIDHLVPGLFPHPLPQLPLPDNQQANQASCQKQFQNADHDYPVEKPFFGHGHAFHPLRAKIVQHK